MDNKLQFLSETKLGKYALEVLSFYVPLSLELPSLRNSDKFMQATVKAQAASGITDVVTEADKYMQKKIKEATASLHPEWQFWGEEGIDNTSEYDLSKPYLLVTDPIEGTNNFRNFIDDQWGSVIAIIDSSIKEPVIGIVAHPTKRIFYLGVKGRGAYILEYTQKRNLVSVNPLNNFPDTGYESFTYNNSPHFNEELTKQVENFFSFGTVLPDKEGASEIVRSRKNVMQKYENGDDILFEDPESGALEAVRNRGTIYFKTSNEMAAVFIILEEIGGKVTDGKGQKWTLGINTLISARTQEDYQYLFNIYKRSL